MGFLLGAYGKLMAGKLYRSLQHQMILVQSKLTRATRDLGDMEKRLTSMQKNQQAQMQSQFQYSIFNYQQGLGLNPTGDNDNNVFRQYQMFQQQQQMQYAQAQAIWSDNFDMYKESMLQPLKDLEDELQTEKDNLESRATIAKEQYDAYKKMEQADAKGMAPEYTGGQG